MKQLAAYSIHYSELVSLAFTLINNSYMKRAWSE